MPTVKLFPIAELCGAGKCPTVYRTDTGTLVVQGSRFDTANAVAEAPTGEQMVEIPSELIDLFVRRMSCKG